MTPTDPTTRPYRLDRDAVGVVHGSEPGHDPADVPLLLRSGVELSGALAWFDVRDPQALPVLTVEDVDAALPWAAVLLGDEAAQTLALLAVPTGAGDVLDRPVHEKMSATVPAVPSTDLEALRRLALGLWVRRFWPAAQDASLPHLDPLLMDAELAVVAWAADDALLHLQQAPDLLRPHLARTIDLLLDAQVGVEISAAAREVLRRAVLVAQETLPDDDPLVDAVDEVAVLVDAIPAEHAAYRSLLTGHRGWLTAVSDPQDDFALAAAAGDGAGRRRRFTVDWLRVPGQCLDAHPESIVVEVVDDADGPAGVVLAVSVQAAAGAPAQRLRVDVHDLATRELVGSAPAVHIGGDRPGYLADIRVDRLPDDLDDLGVSVVAADLPPRVPRPERELRSEQEQAWVVLTGRPAADLFVAERADEEGLPR